MGAEIPIGAHARERHTQRCPAVGCFSLAEIDIVISDVEEGAVGEGRRETRHHLPGGYRLAGAINLTDAPPRLMVQRAALALPGEGADCRDRNYSLALNFACWRSRLGGATPENANRDARVK